MLQKNIYPHRKLNRTSLEVFCVRKGTSGLERTSLPRDVIEKLEREEELEQLLSEMTDPEGDDQQAIGSSEHKSDKQRL